MRPSSASRRTSSRLAGASGTSTPCSSRTTTCGWSRRQAAGALVVPPSEDGVEETLDALDGIALLGRRRSRPDAVRRRRASTRPTTPRGDRDAGELALLRRRSSATCRRSPSAAAASCSTSRAAATSYSTCPRRSATRGTSTCPGRSPITASRCEPGRGSAALIGDRAPVKSHHHQGFGRVGDGLVETAWAEDGTLEGIEDPSRRFAVGVLWHPEAGEDAGRSSRRSSRRPVATAPRRQAVAAPASQRSSS